MNRRASVFALWIVAAFCATMLALGPTTAFAHQGHWRNAQFADDASALANAATATSDASDLFGRGQDYALSASADDKETVVTAAASCHPEHSPRDGICCSGGGRCAPACFVAIGLSLPPHVQIAERPRVRQIRRPPANLIG